MQTSPHFYQWFLTTTRASCLWVNSAETKKKKQPGPLHHFPEILQIGSLWHHKGHWWLVNVKPRLVTPPPPQISHTTLFRTWDRPGNRSVLQAAVNSGLNLLLYWWSFILKKINVKMVMDSGPWLSRQLSTSKLFICCHFIYAFLPQRDWMWPLLMAGDHRRRVASKKPCSWFVLSVS